MIQLTPFTPADDWEGSPFPFFDEPQEPLEKRWFKIYHDGGHYIACPIMHSSRSAVSGKHKYEDIDILFDSLYYAAMKAGLKDGNKEKGQETPLTDFIRAGILKLFPSYPGLDEFIAKKIERKKNNYFHRVKRMRRKANLNRWNYFVTVTYDERKHTPESFRKTLRKCLSNLHTRRGWRYMGVFEYAPETDRLHFHALVYVPDGQMVGTITEKKDYDKHHGTVQTTYSNNFFAANFGRNDFKEITQMNGVIKYLIKYIGKTNERIVYSRGIPTEFTRQLGDEDLAAEMFDFVTKYVLFDDIVEDWVSRNIRFGKQMTVIDLICNPPRFA